MEARRDFDLIVIGSGIGGLTCASLMARLKRRRVLVLERHFKIGGFTHTFSRPGGWTWDVGLHYVGGMEPETMGRKLFDFVTGDQVDWSPMPDVYDHAAYPGFQFAFVKGEKNLRERLIEAFPRERGSIERYFRDLKSAMGWFVRQSMAEAMPAPLPQILRLVNRLTRRLPLSTTAEYLKRRFQDPQLHAVVASQWGDYGLPPSQSAFATHALIATHYFDGAWYPCGGSGEIAKGCGAVIRDAGGELLASHEVTRILVEEGRAVGVEARVGAGPKAKLVEFRAPVVVSDAGAWNTFTRLVPASFPLAFREELASAPTSMEAVELFLGLRGDPRELEFRGENRWVFGSADHDEVYARRNELADGRAMFAYLSFPSLKDPRAKRHTAEVIAPMAHRVFEAYRGQPWLRRSAQYEALKQRITEGLLDLIERHHPGFRGLVEYAELATPLSFEHFTAAPRGCIYGYPGIPERFRKAWIGVRTPVRGLYLTGTDAGSLGIMGAVMGGVAAAGRLLGPFGFFKVMRAVFRKAARPAETGALARA